MARSLGLAAYRAMTRRSDPQLAAPAAPRPKGEVVWLHAGETTNLLAVRDLAKRLAGMRDGLHVLISVADSTTPGVRIEQGTGCLFETVLPSEHPTAVDAFLNNWQPDLCVWIWGLLRPNLILETAARSCPLYLIDADAGGFDDRRDRWLPDLTRRLLTEFSAIYTRSDHGYRRLMSLGAPTERVTRASPLMAGGAALPCTDSDLTELSAAMGGRPAWFAANVLPEELAIVLAAHKQALRLSHRLLLILQPAVPEDEAVAAELAADADLTLVHWDDGEFPDDTTQVMVASDSSDRGLFFRVAPVSFLGGTLVPGNVGCDPLDAAALGSAVLYGPKVRHHMQSYSRLAAAGAARIVIDADTLGTSISRLIAPDQAATMAHAGWDVISQGAALTDQVVDLVQDALDTKRSIL